MKHEPKGVVLMMPFQQQVAVFDSFKSWRKYFKAIGQPLDEENLECANGANAVAGYHTGSNGKIWFWCVLPDTTNLGTIVHECSHLVDFTCDVSGVPVNVENTEIRAYMLGVLFLDVCEVLNRPIDAI